MRNTRCVAILDATLPPGKAANAAAVMALTMGQRQPHLVGEPLVDADGHGRPGLIPIGILVLSATRDEIGQVRVRGLRRDLDVVAFPADGQMTTDYEAFRRRVRAKSADDIEYIGVMVYGDSKQVGKVVGKFSLLA